MRLEVLLNVLKYFIEILQDHINFKNEVQVERFRKYLEKEIYNLEKGQQQ